MSFFRTLFIILVIWYGVKLVTKYLFPLFMQKTMKDMQSRMEGQIRQQQQSQRNEGEITVQQDRNKRNNGQKEGEYVDFEEVD